MRGIELVIRLEHAIGAAALPQHHRDPFDRRLIAQAEHEFGKAYWQLGTLASRKSSPTLRERLVVTMSVAALPIASSRFAGSL
jgi:hypothetical protein